MKPERRQRVTPQPAADASDWREPFRRWGNTVLTLLLVAVIVWMIVRWRSVHQAQARLLVLSQLANAESAVESLANESPARPPASLAAARLNATVQASDAVASVLNSTDEAPLRAQALITRGDLYWHLANLPELPGATTQPSLRISTPADQALQRAAEAYQQALDTYPNQHEAAAAARFGLAAVAENKRDWATAQKLLQAIVDDGSLGAALQDQAKLELAGLPDLQKQLYLATTQPAAVALPLQGPAAPPPLHTPASTASTQPAVAPAVGPAPEPVVKPAVAAPATQAATGPAAPPVVQPAPHPATMPVH